MPVSIALFLFYERRMDTGLTAFCKSLPTPYPVSAGRQLLDPVGLSMK